jgi:hypothetical protein
VSAGADGDWTGADGEWAAPEVHADSTISTADSTGNHRDPNRARGERRIT